MPPAGEHMKTMVSVLRSTTADTYSSRAMLEGFSTQTELIGRPAAPVCLVTSF